jgi:tetratricopeptide (TPR) repeat protein
VKDPDVVRYSLGDRDRVLRLSADPLLRFQKLTLSPADGYVLSRIDGATSAHEIVQMIPLPAEVAERSLLALLSTGVIEYVEGSRRPRPDVLARLSAAAPSVPAAPPRATPIPAAPAQAPAAPAPVPSAVPSPPDAPPPAAASPQPAAEPADEERREILEAFLGRKTRNHYEVLGLSRTATEADVKDAYFRLARRFHPDAHHGESLADLGDELEAVFIRLGEAYEVLKDARRRADYEERIGRLRPAEPGGGAEPTSGKHEAREAPSDHEAEARAADDALRRAAKHHERQEYWDAIQLLEPSIASLPPKARTRARVLLARCYLENPNWVRRAEEVLLAASRDDPQALDAWALLGRLYADKGLAARAQSMFRKVLELKPDHEDAQRFMETAAPRASEAPPEPSSPGLLRKLFRKP